MAQPTWQVFGTSCPASQFCQRKHSFVNRLAHVGDLGQQTFEHYVSLLVAATLLDLREVAFVCVEVAERAAAARRVERLQAVVVCRKALVSALKTMA